jgi:hypothetical protein
MYEKGETVFPSQKIPMSPQVQATGGAGVASVHDGAYATVNPAGIANIAEDLVFLEHINFYQNMKMEYLNTTLLYGKFRLGVSMQYFDMGYGPITNDDGSNYSEDNFFHAYDAVLMVTSKLDYKDFNIGVTLKGLREALWNKSMNGAALDVGCIYKTPVSNLTAGGALMNMGVITRGYSEDRYPLTAMLRLGCAYEYELNESLTIKPLVDINLTNDNDFTVPMGSEIMWDFFTLRFGYHLLHDTQMFSLGTGITFSRFCVDYCFIHFTDDLNTNGRPHFFALHIFI